MLKVFQIDFIREVLNYNLSQNDGNDNYFDDTDISLFSFFEHLVEKNEVDRYVERYNQLVQQQNRDNTIGFGIISTSSVPSITNIITSFISPFEWTCSIRCSLGNRDKMIATIYKFYEDLKGRVQNVIQFDSGKLQVVGIIGNGGGTRVVKDYDFLGKVYSGIEQTIPQQIESKLTALSPYFTTNTVSIVYVQLDNLLKVYKKISNVWTDKTSDYYGIGENVIERRMKLDLSFDDLKCDTPFVLDAKEYCTFSFGGSATLCDENVRLGNDLVRFDIKKYKVKGETDYTFSGDFIEIEPLEMPSGNSANTIANQLRSNYLKANSHTDSTTISIQYSFILDMDNTLLKQWYNYARYGENNLTALGGIQESSITPNIIYIAKEVYSSFGEVEIKTFKAKIVEDIDIENTESDVMTLQVSFQIQGDND